MKKLIASFIFIICIVSLISSCNSESKLQESVATTIEAETDVANVEEVSIENAGIHIKYPRLINLENKSIEEKWNKIIEDRITSDLELLTDSDQYNMTYEVASNSEEELSIVLIGDCFYDGATQLFNFIYTYNISLTTGESKRLYDQTDITRLATNIYNNRGFILETDKKEKLMEYIHSAFENEGLLAEMLSNFDYNEEGEQPYGYSFYEDGKLHLCIEVPHDLGDYIIIEMDAY